MFSINGDSRIKMVLIAPVVPIHMSKIYKF